MSNESLYVHCLQCGARNSVTPEDSQKCHVGDLETCKSCGMIARVVNIKVGNMFEHWLALGLSTNAAWRRAFDSYQSESRHAT